MAVRLPRQLALPVPNTWGGRRRGAGPKRKGPRPKVSHRARPRHNARHPVHVTLRAVSGLPSFRLPRVFPALQRAFRAAQKSRFRICHFSVQSNHVHMLVEAESREVLIRGVQGLAIRLARAVNRVLGRLGKVWGDRYHRRDLGTPAEARNALVYVLNNAKKHMPHFRGLDPCSSARWFNGWDGAPVAPPPTAPVVLAPRTWLLSTGWRTCGPIDAREAPRAGPFATA